MHRPTRRWSGLAVSAGLVVAGAVAAGAPAAAGTVAPAAQRSAAVAAGNWLVGQLTAQDYIPTPTPGQANLSGTANTVLALMASGVAPARAQGALSYLASNVNSYVTVDGADGPGQLALLILDAASAGHDPRTFGGSDLVARLLATQQPSGAFGTATQFTDQYASTYTQGLALAALAAAGVRGTPATAGASSWLVGQQCPASSGSSAGGWGSPDLAVAGCALDPSNFTGPDTNSTSLALEGLAAQGALPGTVSTSATSFLHSAQQADSGYSYYPGVPGQPQSSDSNSTADVIQALVAVGQPPSGATYAALLSFRDSSGGFIFEAGSAPDVLSSSVATPAALGLALPFVGATGSWSVASDGGVFALGGASFFGSMGGRHLNAPIVGIAAAPDGGGYWEAAADGGIFAFGDAPFIGSMGGRHLNAPIVGIAAAPDGGGYWEAAADGGIFAFGDASFIGSMGGRHLNAPIVGIAAAPDGAGYWEVAADGGIFAFGDASFFGSMGGRHLNAPVVGVTASPSGAGYWEVAADGGIFAFGDAASYGSMGGKSLNAPMVAMAPTAGGTGYLEAAADGGLFAFGDAYPFGSLAGIHLAAPIVGFALSPARPLT